MKEIEVPVNGSAFTSNGTEFKVNLLNETPYKTPTTNTPKHEALHAVAEPNLVEEISIIPDIANGSLGHTKFSMHSDIAAAAAYAFGEDGTDWDLFTIEATGGNIAGAMDGAKARLSGKDEHINAVAGYLESEKTMTGNQLRSVLKEVDNGKEVEIIITKPDGTLYKEKQTGVRENVIFLSDYFSEEAPAA